MKKIKNLSRLKRLHQRRLKRLLDRKKNKKYSQISIPLWLPKTPIIPRYERIPVSENWEIRAAKLKAPDNFVLSQNPDEIINFFDTVENSHRSGQDVFLNLLNISEISSDTILLMVSRMLDERFNHRRMVGGLFPENLECRTIFEESGVFGEQQFDLTRVKSTRGSIQRIKNFQVSPEKANHLTGRVKGFFSDREQSAATYETLIELMSNTDMHAGGANVMKEIWWCSVYAMPNKAVFNFLDNGEGICKTATKRIGRELMAFLGFTNNAKLLEDIMNDKIESRTGYYYHGRGLPLIRRRAQNGLIQNVIIITNDVFANISTGEYRIMNAFFKGTFFHWEVSAE